MKKLYVKMCSKVSVAVVALLLFAVPAFAALSTEQQAVATAMDTMITDLTTWGWTAILAVLSFTIGAKLLKKFFNKAT